mmetsp:Transcript_12391/g.45176  ORF Transcript_12391/g.45176 Transcript_12391/m.45176 type:complete len:247 (+) Transcript_12391:397-1137(+)
MVVTDQTELAQFGTHCLRLGDTLHVRIKSQQILYGCLLHLQHIQEMLRVPPYPQLVAPSPFSVNWFNVSCKQIKERTLSCTIRAHNCHPGPHVHTYVDVLECEVFLAGIGEAYVQELKQGWGQFCGLREFKLHRVIIPFAYFIPETFHVIIVLVPLLALLFVLHFLLQLLLFVFTVCSLGGLLLFQVLLVHFVLLSTLLLIHVFEHFKVAAVGMQLKVMKMDDVGCNCVEEVAIVGHHNKCLLPFL